MDDLIKFLRARLDEDTADDADYERQIIDSCVEVIGQDPNAAAAAQAVKTLRLLAVPHVDHPGYRQEWRP